MKKSLLTAAAILCFLFNFYAQNVGINTNGATPSSFAGLDINFENKGLLIPRVNITDLENLSPITGTTGDKISLLVYNTNATTGKGYHYWDGDRWKKFADEEYWKLGGNTGTTPNAQGVTVSADNNFIGTTDSKDLVLVANGYEKMRIKPDGNNMLRIGMGTTFTANYNTGSTPSLLHINDWGKTANDFAVLSLSASNLQSNSRQGVINFAAAGADGTATELRKTAAIESYLVNGDKITMQDRNGQDSVFYNVAGDLRFYTNDGNQEFKEKMRITPEGNVGIGTADPKAPLHIADKRGKFSSTDSITYFNNKEYFSPSQPGWLKRDGNISWGDVSLIAHGSIVTHDAIIAASGATYSDQRIKSIQNISNSTTDLETLNKIKITDYKYIDSIKQGNGITKKVIAQQVEEIYPTAVSQVVNYIPNVYTLASRIEQVEKGTKIYFENGDKISTKDQVKLITPSSEGELVTCVEAGENYIITKERIDESQVFVYGKEVNDFRVVDYDALAMLNISATQEIYKLLKASNEKTQVLEEKVARLEQGNSELQETNGAIQERLEKIEAQLNMRTEK